MLPLAVTPDYLRDTLPDAPPFLQGVAVLLLLPLAAHLARY